MAKFDPQPTINPEPIVPKFETRDYVADIFFPKYLGSIRAGGFAPHIPEIYTQILRMFTALFSHFFRRSTDALVGPIFTLNTSFDTDLRKVVPFGVRKFKFKI